MVSPLEERILMKRAPLVLLLVAALALTTGIAAASSTTAACVAYNGSVFNVIREHGINDGSRTIRVFPLERLGVKVPGGWLIAANVQGTKLYGWGVWAITKNPATLSSRFSAAAWGRVYSVNKVAKAHTDFPAWTQTLPTGATVGSLACSKGGR